MSNSKLKNEKKFPGKNFPRKNLKIFRDPFYFIVFNVNREVIAIFQCHYKDLKENKKIIEKNHNECRGVYDKNSALYETFKNKHLILEIHQIQKGLK